MVCDYNKYYFLTKKLLLKINKKIIFMVKSLKLCFNLVITLNLYSFIVYCISILVYLYKSVYINTTLRFTITNVSVLDRIALQ